MDRVERRQGRGVFFFLAALASASVPAVAQHPAEPGTYIGSKKCAACHPAQARGYQANGMSRTLQPVSDCDILKTNTHMEWRDGVYRYSIEKQGKGYAYRVTDGNKSAEANLLWALGQGQSQTYVFQVDGTYYESRVSYYERLKGLSLTMGAASGRPRDIGQALGRALQPRETRDCFGCHSSGARPSGAPSSDSDDHGVQCEACHGPGTAHVDSIAAGKCKPGTIRALKGMSAETANNLCGSCHRTWQMVMLLNVHGVETVRFQPYRLSLSQCFVARDKRIACSACHDPHAGLIHEAKAYDAKCRACHNSGNASIHSKSCPVAKEACTSCHMPRYELPGANQFFADHWIRIARRGEAYPE